MQVCIDALFFGACHSAVHEVKNEAASSGYRWLQGLATTDADIN
jgi:hypothetical protein